MRHDRPANEAGRSALNAWRADHPENAYLADGFFRRILGLYAGEKTKGLEEDLVRFGAEVAGPLDTLVRENNLHTNLPRLEKFDGLGNRQEKIEHHPTYHQAGRYIYGSGVMEAYGDHPNHLGALSRFYVSSYNGEAGHNCPLACTAGVIRVLQELGSDELKQRFLQRLLDRDYDIHYEGAQFLTEVQGGSDVGANACVARNMPDGSWRLSGEKWFCSNIDADLYLMTARPDGADAGTRGLGLFLVPRLLEDGRVNGVHVRRLKDKLGTRSMASGEADFVDAVAYHMGEVGHGFKHMMELVINTSRLYNAVGCSGVARRAYVTAQLYAKHREAFGQPVLNYPLMQEHLANMRADLQAMTSGTFYLVANQDAIERAEADESARGFQRMSINLNKLVTAKWGRQMTVDAIEVLGGNGAIESFSVLPRLLRDAIVYENWEGTHNTLIMQIYRDMKRYKVHEAFFEHTRSLLRSPAVCERRGPEVERALNDVENKVNQALEMHEVAGPVVLRNLCEPIAATYYAAVRLSELAKLEKDTTEDQVLEHFMERHLRTPTLNEAYFKRVASISQGV